jgi:A/G-specific adenine glycosylase
MPAGTAGIPAPEWPLFRRRLLSWFGRAQRDLPWRRGTPKKQDPYRIWLSEIMLQQTRVAAVIPYYRRFLKRFPTVAHLARARPAAVLRAWAGLGYYSRARHLHLAARKIVVSHHGKFPRDLQAALALPGIGSYTAAAVLSIAHGQPLAVLDGNVARVLARLEARRGELRRPAAWRQLQTAADALLARQAPGDWNQAMMELGATVCTPRAPRCPQCPVERWCRARALGLAERLPPARRKTRAVKITVAAAVLLDPRGRTLLVRRPGGDGVIFSRLWQFPAVEAGRDARQALPGHLLRTVFSGPAASAARARPSTLMSAATLKAAMKALPPARHTVTFRQIQLLPFLLRVRRLPPVAGARTLPLNALGGLAVSNATRKIASAALQAI